MCPFLLKIRIVDGKHPVYETNSIHVLFLESKILFQTRVYIHIVL